LGSRAERSVSDEGRPSANERPRGRGNSMPRQLSAAQNHLSNPGDCRGGRTASCVQHRSGEKQQVENSTGVGRGEQHLRTNHQGAG
jgi:hypothetical protein